jgi:hypothetical protein
MGVGFGEPESVETWTAAVSKTSRSRFRRKRQVSLEKVWLFAVGLRHSRGPLTRSAGGFG